FKTYIVCECGDDMILIDKHAAHERIRFEQLKTDMKAASQLLTEGIRLTLSLEEITALADNLDYLEDLGMDLFFLSDTELEILGFPSVITNKSPEDTIQRIAEILINGGDNIEGELFDDFLHSVACKGAIKAHEATSDKELETLAKRIWEDQAIRYCPHGRPIITTLSKYNIERNFGRIQ
ncbi:MAG: DNA mismatch repair protein MutL, partial [Ruminiclostridium sp.]|nr:DNA mismatch repair protein MutL [Ruminiclostridium sp.]